MKRNICRYLTGLLCAAVLVVGVLPTQAAAAEENIPVDAAHFPDAAFRDFITSAEYKVEEGSNACTPIDRNQDGQLSQEEREAVVSIVLGKDDPMGSSGRASVDTDRYPIADLTGIGYFPNLTYLQIGGRMGDDPTEYPGYLTGTVDLRDNRKLKTVILANGGVSDVDITGLTFDTLDLHGNHVEDPDLSEQGESMLAVSNYSVGTGERAGHPVVCLDAGHYGKYNRSPVVPAYYESDMAWKLHVMLKEELETYGIEVKTTRPNQDENLAIVQRGLMAENCDLFISIHSNASESSSPDRPEAIHFVPRADSDLDEKSAEIAKRLGQTVYEVMGTKQKPKAYSRLSSDDRDGNGKYDDNYYGVLFGAQTVGTPGLILEHSFHTNERAANWLMQESNLRKLAVAEAKTIADWLEEQKPEPKPEWKQDEIGWRYEYPDGSVVTDRWAAIDGAWYHFDAKGYMQTGWQDIEGQRYYLAPNGPMVTGWREIEGVWYYFNGSGYMQTGWQEVRGDKYYFDAEGRMQTGWQDMEGKRYHFAPGGALQTGWQDIEGKRYYFALSGAMQTGWQDIEGKRYYFALSGAMQTGWQDIEGKRYYFYDGGALAANTWIDGEYVDDSGAWVEHPVFIGWQQMGGAWYYFDADGVMQTDWQHIGSYWYYFAPDGTMQTGWQHIGSYWYHFAPEGNMQTGWQHLGSYWYYIAPEGNMLTGWQHIGSYWYYFAPAGNMLTDWQWIDGKCYYFYAGGNMAADTWIDGCYLDGSGAWVEKPVATGWQRNEVGWWYNDANGNYVTGWQHIGSYWYYFAPNGYMLTGWQWIGGKCYYFYEAGNMAANTWIGGSYVDGSGAWVQ